MESKEEKIYEIDINKKYILMSPGELNKEAKDRLKKIIAEWIHDPNQPFLILPLTGWKLLKVETPNDDV